MRGKGQAKNGDKLFWEEKFHAANGKAQAHTNYALHFFLLSLGGGGFRGGYFSVFPGSHYVDHPTTLWLGPSREGGGAPANRELPHQGREHHFFIRVRYTNTSQTLTKTNLSERVTFQATSSVLFHWWVPGRKKNNHNHFCVCICAYTIYFLIFCYFK